MKNIELEFSLNKNFEVLVKDIETNNTKKIEVEEFEKKIQNIFTKEEFLIIRNYFLLCYVNMNLIVSKKNGIFKYFFEI